jgi:hypothetical protein
MARSSRVRRNPNRPTAIPAKNRTRAPPKYERRKAHSMSGGSAVRARLRNRRTGMAKLKTKRTSPFTPPSSRTFSLTASAPRPITPKMGPTTSNRMFMVFRYAGGLARVTRRRQQRLGGRARRTVTGDQHDRNKEKRPGRYPSRAQTTESRKFAVTA